ncbi:MAG: hypothetical protein HXX16_05135 [Bacteroidales bacterium]|nr:hypothetical protein [Bacteroidales bacterium]
MPEKFQNRYRIPSARLQSWDYGANGAYFITICTKNRYHFFGEIANGQMNLNEIGLLSNKCWDQIPIHFPFVQLGAFVTMPNHVQGILIINKPDDGRNHGDNNCGVIVLNGVNEYVDNVRGNGNNDCYGNVETQNFASLPSTPPTLLSTPSKNKFGPQSQNLASIVRGYKIGVTTNARLINPNFAWQPRYHDHIIRNSAEFERIQNYILNNPENWKGDKFYE